MQLIPYDARFPDLHQATTEIFSDLQLDMVACDLCGEVHPPELHAQRFTADFSEIEDA